MEEMIGYCGYSCHLCAARSDDSKSGGNWWTAGEGYSAIRTTPRRTSGATAAGRMAGLRTRTAMPGLRHGKESGKLRAVRRFPLRQSQAPPCQPGGASDLLQAGIRAGDGGEYSCVHATVREHAEPGEASGG